MSVSPVDRRPGGRPPGMPWVGTTGGAGQAKANPLDGLWSKRNTASMARMPQELKWWQLWKRWVGRVRSEN